MKIILLVLLSAFTVPLQNAEIAMLGVKIHDPKKVLSTIPLSETGTEKSRHTYRLNDGNDLSITIDDGKVVMMENEWMHRQKGTKPLIGKFVFGKTTLTDIKKALGTEGFCYERNFSQTNEADVVNITCFNVESHNDEVLVVITKAPFKASITRDIQSYQTLETIILADKKYLDKIWGKKRAEGKNTKVEI
jgi:hypothetical protein